jgi:hypothetical protein
MSDFAAAYNDIWGGQPVKYAAQIPWGEHSLSDEQAALLRSYHETGDATHLSVLGDHLQEFPQRQQDSLIGTLLSRSSDGHVHLGGSPEDWQEENLGPSHSASVQFIPQSKAKRQAEGWGAEIVLTHPYKQPVVVSVPASREELQQLHADRKPYLMHYGADARHEMVEHYLKSNPDSAFLLHSSESKSAEPERYSRGQKAAGGVSQALRLLRSKNQQRVRDIAGQIAQRLGLSGVKMRDAVTLTASPVAAVAMAVYHGGDEEQANQAAAYLGHLLQLPASSAFHIKPDGGDSLYKLTLPLAPDKAAQLLQSYGIRRSVLSPVKKGTEVLIHDPGHFARDRVESLAAAAGVAEIQHSTGATVHFGDDEQQPRANAAARKSYRDAINRGQ